MDQWKAFDRVFVPFLLAVMKGMGFGDVFVEWVKVLHSGNSTRFLLQQPSVSVPISFSVRQGDPIALVLYLFVMEPLLLRIRKLLPGLVVGGVRLVDFAYVDDENVVVTSDRDFLVVDQVFRDFEGVSGAVLNRDMKTKILGLGRWAGRTVWPLPWVMVVQELKVFGFLFLASYKELVRRNWEVVEAKVRKVLASWESRSLPRMSQRVEVLRTFVASLVWYKCQVLALPVCVAGRLEGQLGKFLWRGKLERVAWSSVVLPRVEGGLGMVDIRCQARAMRMVTVGRQLVDKEGVMARLASFWMGVGLRGIFPYMVQGMNVEEVPIYYRDLTRELVVLDSLVPAVTWGEVRSKVVYGLLRGQVDLRPAIEEKVLLEGEPGGWSLVWGRLWDLVVDPGARDPMWRMLHNVLPTRQRLHRLGMCSDQYCAAPEDRVEKLLLGPREEGLGGLGALCVGGQVDSVLHLFTECVWTRECWGYVRRRCLGLLPRECVGLSDWELLFMYFPEVPKVQASTVIWLVTTYVDLVVRRVLLLRRRLRMESMVLEMRIKYLQQNVGRRVRLLPLDFGV